MERQQQRHHNYNRREPIVEDLRDKLNRMRLEKSSNADKDEKDVKLPPPDPAYNFLKDPLRGDIVYKKHNKQETKRIDESKSKGVREYLKQPININVEISSESGERKCTLDESKIVEISVLNREYPKRPQFRRTPGEFYQHYNKKNNTLFTSSNNNSNYFVTKIVENLHNDKEGTKSNTNNTTKCTVKKNVKFNCKNEACISNSHENTSAVETSKQIELDKN